MSDAINPSHYQHLPAEAIEIIEAAIDKAPSNQAALMHGQVLKYVLRCWHKKGIEDLRKAKWYLDRLIDSFEANEPEQPKPTLNSDKIPKGYRKLGDSSIEPRRLGDLRWSVFQNRYVGMWGAILEYANRDNCPACRKIEEPLKRYREPTLEDLANGLIECEYRDNDDEQWRSGLLVYMLKGAMPFLCTDKEELLCGQWAQCRIEAQE